MQQGALNCASHCPLWGSGGISVRGDVRGIAYFRPRPHRVKLNKKSPYWVGGQRGAGANLETPTA